MNIGASNKKIFIATLVFVSVIFLLIVFWGFPDSPSPWFDNGVNLGEVKTFVRDGVYSLGLGPNDYAKERGLAFSTNYPLFFFLILSFKLFGIGLWQAQIVMVIFMTIFLALAYSLNKVLSNDKILSLLGIALLITFLPFYGNGLSGGLGEVPGLVYFVGGLLLSRKEKPWIIFLSGIFFGLSAATKVFNVLLLPCLLVGELWYAWQAKKFLWKRWLIMLGGLALPLLVWFFLIFPFGTVAESFRSTYSYYSNPYLVKDSFLVLRNIIKFVTETTPIHFFILTVVFIGGLLLKKKNQELKRIEIIIVSYVLLNVLWFVRTPGWYRYFFPAHLLVLALFPSALSGWFENKTYKKFAISGILALLLLAQTMQLVRERNSRLYYNSEPRQVAHLIDRELGPDADVFIINQPEMWFLLDNKMARQYLRMSPHKVFGAELFGGGALPLYILSAAEPSEDSYLSLHLDEFDKYYKPYKEYGRYVIYIRR